MKHLRHLVIFVFAFHMANLVHAQTIGSSFNSADGKMIYTFTLMGNTKTLKVKKRGSPMGTITIPDSVNFRSVNYAVTGIETYAFLGCIEVDTVTIGCNVRSIGLLAFKGCEKLKEINFNATNCDDLKSTADAFVFESTDLCTINIGSNVKRIPAYIFSNIKPVTAVNFVGESACTSIGESAFAGCSNTFFTKLVLQDSLQTIGQYAFAGCGGIRSLTIGSGVRNIGDFAFADMYRLETVNFNATACEDLSNTGIASFGPSPFSAIIGKQVTRIPGALFKESSLLDSVTFESDSTCTEIGPNAFSRTTRLTYLTLPRSITTIGSGAFSDCTGLNALFIPKAVTFIGTSAFSRSSCQFEVEDGNPEYSEVESVLYNKDRSILIQCPITRSGIFHIPASVTKIGPNAFGSCERLSAVTIPDGVTSIETGAFSNCTGILNLILPNSLDSIGGNAFNNCKNLALILAQQSTPPWLTGSNVFTKIAFRAKLYVPTGSRNAYNAQYGVYFKSGSAIIEEFGVLTHGGVEYLVTDTALRHMSVFRLPVETTDSNITIPASLAYQSKNYSVTAIGNDAFNNCSKLTSITLPPSVLTLGNYSFSGCTGLTSITLPDSMLSIGTNAFQRCVYLNTVTIGKSVKTIGDYAFQACSQLAAVTIPDSVVYIGAFAFSDCGKLSSLQLGSSLTRIGSNAFKNCQGLSSVTIPEAITSLGDNAFYSCKGLLSVNFNARQCKSMGSSNMSIKAPFYECSSLSTINIGNEVTQLPNYAFCYCLALKTLNGGKSLKRIGDYAFVYCSNLSLNAIPDSVTDIGRNAFSNCTGLTTMTLGAAIDSIGILAFSYCTNLQSVSFDAVNCKYMGEYFYPVFSGCSALTSATVGKGVTHLPNATFYNCTKLASITMESSTPPTLGSDVFTNILPTAVLFVPGGSKVSYMNVSNSPSYTRSFSSAGSTIDGARIVELPTTLDTPTDAGITLSSNGDRQLVIQGVNELHGRVGVYNMAGQLETTGLLTGSHTVLPETLAPGMYMVVLQTNNCRKTVKIRVE